MAQQTDVYLGNPNLKKAGTEIQFTKKQVEEWIKCKEDPLYFACKYMQIINLDEGLVPFSMYDFQKKILSAILSTIINSLLTSIGILVHNHKHLK